MPIRIIYDFTKRLFKNLYFLMFLNGFLVASFFYFRTQSTFENGLFASIKNSIDSRIDKDDNSDSIALKAMFTTHYLMSNRATIFGNIGSLGAETDFFHPTYVDLMTTAGACGSYSQVLARVLQTYHYPIRIAQMKAGNVWAAHNLVEVNTGDHWVILDPTFNTHFVRPDNRLASFDDVKKDWPYYSRQVPAGYDLNYRYEDVRYSNWTKIPVIFPAIKGTLNLFIGRQKADTISMRTLFLRVYDIYYYGAILLFIPIFFFTIRRVVQTKVFPNPDIPVTFRNLIRHLRSARAPKEAEVAQ